MNIKAIEADVSIRSGINGAVSIANGLVESDTQIGREVIKTVYEEPVLESLSVTANGNYEPAEGIDGFSDVSVLVPERIPVTESLSVTENGTYEPEEGVDGYSNVTVSIPIYDGETEIDAESIDITLPTNGNVMQDDIVIHGFDVKSKYTVSGAFTAREDGVLTIDTGYDGEGDPHIIVVWADGEVRSDDFLEEAPVWSFNTLTCTKRNASKSIYGTTNAMNSQCYTNYSRKNDTDGYSMEYTNTTLVLSRKDLGYGIGGAFKFYDSRTMRVFAASEPGETGGAYFATGIKYRYFVVYNEPYTEEPEETNVFEGEFEATEDGALTIDTGYTGEGFPKMLIITPAGGLMNADFLSRSQSAQKRYAIAALSSYKKNSNVPVYDSEDEDSALSSWYIYINSSNAYALNSGTCYYYKTDEPDRGNLNLIKIADSRHIKIFTATGRGGSSTYGYFVTGEKYRYQVYY